MIDDHQELLRNIIMRTSSEEQILYTYTYLLKLHFLMIVLVMMLAGYLRDPTIQVQLTEEDQRWIQVQRRSVVDKFTRI